MVKYAPALVMVAILMVAPTSCAPPEPAAPRPTAPALLAITPAATLDIDATATALARPLALTVTPTGLYVVQPGDTLSGLAARFGTTVDDLIATNGLTDPNALQVGQSLIIPSQLNAGPTMAPTP